MTLWCIPVAFALFAAWFATILQPARARRRALPWTATGTACVLALLAVAGIDLVFVLFLPFAMLWVSLGVVMAKKCPGCGAPRLQRAIHVPAFCSWCGAPASPAPGA